jgi:hypothetical protein
MKKFKFLLPSIIKSIERRQEVLASENLIQPETLDISRKYLRLDRPGSRIDPVINTITFIAYDSCPAFVVVQDLVGIKFRCPRDEIYLCTDGNGGEEVAS